MVVFWDIIDTNNHLLLDKNHTPDKKYTEKEELELQRAWVAICDQYFTAKNDDRSRAYLRNRNQELYLTEKIRAFNSVYTTLYELNKSVDLLPKADAAVMLKKIYDSAKKIEPRTKISYTNTAAKNIKLCESAMHSLTTLYRVKFNNRKEQVKKEYKNPFEIVVLVQGQLGYALPDINTISTEQWIAYENQANQKARAVQKDIASRKGGKNGR